MRLQSLMRELEARDAREREAGLPPAQRMRALVPEAGRFIHIVVRAMRARQILEIGTSYGYSTLWLASAAQAHGGRVDTLELNAERFAAAAEHFRRAGLSDSIRQYQGDARQIIPTLGDEYDCVFIDAEKDDYEAYLALTLNKVVRGGVIMADNVLSHADKLQHYSETAQHTPGLLSVTVPVGRGEEMSLRVGDTVLPPEVVVALAELELRARTRRAAPGLPRAAGKLLYILARAAHAKSALDLGGAGGAAGLWLAAALQATGGRALGIESDSARVKLAEERFAKAKVAPQISMATGTPRDVVPTLEGAFDFVYVDAARHDYVASAEALWSKLKPDALIVAGNVPAGKPLVSRADALSVSVPLAEGMALTLKV